MRRVLTLHGRQVVYRMTGTGPPVVLIHGLVNSSRHWRGVVAELAGDYTLIAPDLIGHGDSTGRGGDYSIGGHASGIRDLLSALGVDRATIVGHSIGGGIAMQFYYQFPERCERLALISAGGLGREVSPALRIAALPGTGVALALVARRRTLAWAERAGDALAGHGLRAGAGLRNAARSLRPLEERAARRGFLQTLRGVVGVRGQRISARDRLYLGGALPMLIVWGGRDRTIPVEHGRFAEAQIERSSFVLLPRSGHFPLLDDPAGLANALRDFIGRTAPAALDEDGWRALLVDGGERSGAAVVQPPR